MKSKDISLKDFVKEIGFPYIVHACVACENEKQFPSHSHGMELIGEPEYLINARCFGPEGNTCAINTVHTYLKENPDLKSDILAGETIEMKLDEKIILCLRKVDKNFAAVQVAYESCDLDEMSFIHIYVKGDDFALADEYYLAGEPF